MINKINKPCFYNLEEFAWYFDDAYQGFLLSQLHASGFIALLSNGKEIHDLETWQANISAEDENLSQNCYVTQALRADPLGALSFFYTQLAEGQTLSFVELVRNLEPDSLNHTNNKIDENYQLQISSVVKTLLLTTGFELIQECAYKIDMGASDQLAKYYNADYLMLWKVRKKSPIFRVAKLQKKHFNQFSTLFFNAFNETIDQKFYEWKYAQGLSVGVFLEDQLIAHSGAFLRMASFKGQSFLSYQIGDNMVHSEKRAFFSKHNPFYLVTSTQLILAQTNGLNLGFGFPNVRAYKIGEKLGLYQDAGALFESTESLEQLEISAEINYPKTIKTKIFNHSNFMDAQDEILQCSAFRSKNLQEKIYLKLDWQYLQQRYFSHPCYEYQLFMICQKSWLTKNKPLGMIIFRITSDTFHVMLTACASGTEKLLIELFKQYARELHIKQIKFWGSQQYLQTLGLLNIQNANITIPSSALYPVYPLKTVQDAWHLELGDTDFV